MMSFNIVGSTVERKVFYLLLGLFYLVNLSSLSYAENIDVGKLLGIRDKGELNKITGEAEKVYQKTPKDKNNLLTLGMAYHSLADMKVKGAPEKCIEYLKPANKLYPEDALILAVLGSCMTMVGRDSSNITDKMRYVNEGTPMIDKAVNMAPDNVFIRMVRAGDSAGLPKLFGRMKYVKNDLLHIEGVIKKSPKEVPVDLQAEVYYKLGRLFIFDGDGSSAKSYFKKAVEVCPDSEWGKMAKKEL